MTREAWEIHISIEKSLMTLLTFVLLLTVVLVIAAGWHFEVLKPNDAAICFATLLGPILAVQIQAWRESVRSSMAVAEKATSEQRGLQRVVFRQMMVYRSQPLDPLFTQAVNAIPLDFQNVPAVMSAWKTYFDHLSPTTMQSNTTQASTWQEKCNDYRANLLVAMGKHLGYEFTVAQVKDEAYLASGQVTLQETQARISIGLIEVMEGKRPLQVRLVPETEGPTSGS